MFIVSISIVSMILSLIQCTPIEILNTDELLTEIEDHTPILILSQTKSSSPDGSFNYSFETGNHIKQQVNGYRKTVFVPRIRDDGTKSTDELDTADVIVQSGSYSFIAPDGTIISVNFIADENGFQAFGDSVPTPPSPSPLPETVLRTLQHYSPNDDQLKEERQQQQTPQLLAASQENGIILTSGADQTYRNQRSSSFS